jgi:hypothetical protein
MVVSKTGVYTLYLGSDDGSMLWMGDTAYALIDNSGQHKYATKSAERMMTEKIPTAIRIDYFEATFQPSCKFSYKGPETGDQEKVVPRRALLQTSPLTGLLLEGFYLNAAAGACDYSEEACRTKAAADGLEFGGAGDYTTKGCYSYSASDTKYAGTVWYGKVSGGDVKKESQLNTLKEGQIRVSTCPEAEYTHIAKGCVDGHNIVKYTGKTVDECKAICDMKTGCKAFEFGVAYGGSGKYGPGDCSPQSSIDKEGCDGASYNLDLYIKEEFDEITGIPSDLVDRVPDVSMPVSTVNYEESKSPWVGFTQSINFAARFTGAIVVKKGGEYKFWLGCDEGCKLFVGATYDMVIDNGGVHSYEEKSGSTELIEGEHPIMITYVQKGGASALRFFWQGEDTENKRTIVGDMGGAGVFRRLAGPSSMPELSLLSHEEHAAEEAPLTKSFLSREEKASSPEEEAPALNKPPASFLARAEDSFVSGITSMFR